jgi:two-component system, cell cycle response regulator
MARTDPPMPRTTIDAILHSPRLPSLPMVAVRVLELTRDENVNFGEVAQVIENDQALALRIIRTVNSSYYGLSRPCTTINQAIVYMGLDAVKTLVLGFSLVDSIDGSSDHDIGFDYASYWRRSLHSAVAARELAKADGRCDPEEAFLAALIQDVGMVALHRAFRDVYLQLLDLTHGDHERLVKLERQSLEMDHAEFGAAIGENWELPPQLISVIRHHHDAHPPNNQTIVNVVIAAGRIATALRAGDDLTKEARSTVERAIEQMIGIGQSGKPATAPGNLIGADGKLDRAEVDALVETVSTAAKELASLFKINIETPMALDQLLDDAEQLRIEREVMCRLRYRDAVTTAQIADRHTFRHRLHTAVNQAKEHGGCVGVMACEPVYDDAGIKREQQRAGSDHGTAAPSLVPSPPLTAHGALAAHIAAEIGTSGVVCADGSPTMVFVPRTDRIVIARLAETLRQRLAADGITINIGAAAYEPEAEPIILDDRALVILAEKALRAAREAGTSTVRVFNPLIAGNDRNGACGHAA